MLEYVSFDPLVSFLVIMSERVWMGRCDPAVKKFRFYRGKTFWKSGSSSQVSLVGPDIIMLLNCFTSDHISFFFFLQLTKL